LRMRKSSDNRGKINLPTNSIICLIPYTSTTFFMLRSNLNSSGEQKNKL
jgi:hypothetical protein